MKREQNNSSINIIEDFGDEQSQVESTKSYVYVLLSESMNLMMINCVYRLRARFESMRETSSEQKSPRVKVNRFVVSRKKRD